MERSALPSLSFFNLFADPDKDASSILVELERGLRSGRVGDLCESLWFFSRLFSSRPFPVVINNTLLKLADLWRISNNFVRACLLSIFSASEGFFTANNVLNCEEVMRRVTSVLQSNDALARALTLRAIGCMPLLIVERIDVHYMIHKSLESRIEEEFSAAIFAADKLLPLSEVFASASVSKIAQAIRDFETPSVTKLKLIRLFRHFHHSPSLSAQVLRECEVFLEIYPSQEYVVSLLASATTLARSNPSVVTATVSLVRRFVEGDPRRRVRSFAVRQLGRLARVAPYRTLDSAPVCDILLAPNLTPRSLHQDALRSMICFVSASGKPLSEDCLQDVLQWAAHADSHIAGAALQLLVASLPSERSLLAQRTAASATALAESWRGSRERLKRLRPVIVQLVGKYPPASAMLFSSLAPYLISTEGITYEFASLLVDITDLQPSIAPSHATLIAQAYSRFSHDTLVPLSALLFRSHVEMLPSSSVVLSSGWSNYLVGQQALCSGQYHVAAEIFRRLQLQVETEYFYFWLGALHSLSRFEADLLPSLSTAAGASFNLIEQAQVALQAAVNPSAPMTFQLQFLYFRSHLVRLLVQLMETCDKSTVGTNGALPAPSTRVTQTRVAQHRVGAKDAADWADRLVRSFLGIDRRSAALLKRLTHALAELTDQLAPDRLSSETSLAAIYGMCSTLLSARCVYPRFFFRMKYTPAIKLLASPTPRPQFDPQVVPFGTALVLKISGHVSDDSLVQRRALQEAVLSFALSDGIRQRTASKQPQDGEQIIVPLRKGAFTATYRVQFPMQAQSCIVHLACQLKDAAEHRWCPVDGELLFHFKNGKAD